ncbi:MAG: dihydrolipoyl dehydrogenase [Nitrospirae bacterium]|nr:dihydrolipoyl dehydrogenase [Nitrospirota bacterium]
MTQGKVYDLVVLGAGPGGYVSAIRAAQSGLKAAIIEKEKVGGVCLNRGCIPSKALIKNAEIVSVIKKASEFGITYDHLKIDYSVAVKRSQEAVSRLTQGVEFLLKKHKVDLIMGRGIIRTPQSLTVESKTDQKEIQAQNIIIATGSRARSLPGIEIDGQLVMSSTEALLLTRLPENLLIVGGGAVGVEFAYIFSSYGVKVTLIEVESSLLPREDAEIGQTLGKAFSKQKIEVKTGCQLGALKEENGKVLAQLLSKDKEETKVFERVLVATGRTPNSENIGLDQIGVKTQKGFIQVGPFMQTSISNVYAIGDVAGKALLAHTAMAEGITAVEKILGKDPPPFDYLSIPNCVYCQPQVASMGYTEKSAVEKGYQVKIGMFPYRANGKAVAIGETDGFVKLVTDAETEELLGAHLIGIDASEHISEMVLARRLEATAGEIARTVHPHPTLSEAIMEASEDVFGKAIHIWKGN